MPPPSTQLQIFTMGLQGSGKTTTSICLVELLHAKWLNQDEFSHLNRGAKSHFMAHLSANSGPDAINPILIVDRINTTLAHRSDIFTAMKSVGIRVGIYWDSSVQECISRVKGRSFGHKSILPGANIGLIVGRTAKEFVPISEEEIDTYGIQKVITISGVKTRFEVVRQIIDEISQVADLSMLGIDKISDDQILHAVKIAEQRELDICKINEGISNSTSPTLDLTCKRVTIANRFRAEIAEGRFEIHFKNKIRFKNIFEFVSNPNFTCKKDFHVTLLYINKALAKALNEEKSSAHHEAIKAYKRLQSDTILVVLEYVAYNERVMAAKCSIIHDQKHPLKHFDVIPHVSIGKIADAQFRECNELIEQVEKLKHEPALFDNHNSPRWIDLTDSEPIEGYIRFAKHGQ